MKLKFVIVLEMQLYGLLLSSKSKENINQDFIGSYAYKLMKTHNVNNGESGHSCE